jgi:hypothetical protein
MWDYQNNPEWVLTSKWTHKFLLWTCGVQCLFPHFYRPDMDFFIHNTICWEVLFLLYCIMTVGRSFDTASMCTVYMPSLKIVFICQVLTVFILFLFFYYSIKFLLYESAEPFLLNKKYCTGSCFTSIFFK